MTQHPQQRQPDVAMLSYRVDQMERDMTLLEAKFTDYARVSEYDLRLQSIAETIKRIEASTNTAIIEISDMNKKLAAQDTEAQKRDAAQKASIDRLLIRILWGFVCLIISIPVSLIIGYLTHVVH